MWFFGSRKADVLEQRVTALQAALKQCSEVAGRWTTFRGGTTAVIAVAMLALGFVLGSYREPIHQSIVGVAQEVGVAKPASAFDTAQDAYQKGDYEAALRLARPLADEGDARAHPSQMPALARKASAYYQSSLLAVMRVPGCSGWNVLRMMIGKPRSIAGDMVCGCTTCVGVTSMGTGMTNASWCAGSSRRVSSPVGCNAPAYGWQSSIGPSLSALTSPW